MLCGDLNSTKMTFVSLLYGYRFRRTLKDVGFQGENKANLYSYISRDLSVLRPASVDYKFSAEVQGKITAATNFQKHPPDWPKSPPPPNHIQSHSRFQIPSQFPPPNHSPSNPQNQDVSWALLVPAFLIGYHSLYWSVALQTFLLPNSPQAIKFATSFY